MKTVFFSWQSDSHSRTNRELITASVKEALARLNIGLTYDEATEQVRGSPDILTLLQNKIRSSTIFVADLTIVGKYREDRATVNPNVLTEYGMAAGSIGPERILSIMNSNSGSPRDLPFDLDKKYVAIRYDLSDQASTDDISKVRYKLIKNISAKLEEIWRHAIFEDLTGVIPNVVEYLVTTAKNADGYDRAPTDLVSSLLNIEKNELQAAIDILEAKQWIKHRNMPNCDEIMPLSPLFWKFDEIFMGWQTESDAIQIATWLVNGDHPRKNQARTPDIAKGFGWSQRRINPALTYLVGKEIVDDAGYDNPTEFAYFKIRELTNTRLFLTAQHD